MKKGDVLLCKKECKYEKIKFEKNKKYTISEIDYNKGNIDSIYMDCLGDKTILDQFGLWFDFNENENEVIKYIWDYFYTTEEIRKLKLESL
ncbi:hypothetical protein M0Q50_10390 [bacterium]|jgi:hypothetical protein|nr:hypothetical protein [bacterium]